MNIEEYRDYCLAKPGVTEGFPFDEKVLVFKVMGKMFALTDIDEFDFVNLKCDPQKALEHAQSAYDLDNANKWYVLRLAYIYFNAGDYHKSASFFKQTIEDEKSLDIKLKYAEALIYSHQYEDAIKMLDEIEVETGKSAQLSLTKHDI